MLAAPLARLAQLAAPPGAPAPTAPTPPVAPEGTSREAGAAPSPKPAARPATAPRNLAKADARAAGRAIRKGIMKVTAPPEAEVFLDGRSVGRGDVQLPVAEGAHRIEVRLGKARVAERFTVAGGETWTYDVTPTK